MPRVSVVMPVYNAEAFLQEAVGSILHQTYRDFELIAIDDGSTDGSREMLRQYGKSDSRVKVLDQENRGLTRTLKRGVEVACGELIARMDSDDMSEPERLAEQVAHFEAHPGCVLLGTAVTVVEVDGTPAYVAHVPADDVSIRARLRETSPFYHGAVMFRRGPAIDCGSYDQTLPIHVEDISLWRRMADRGTLANLAAPLYRYRMVPTSQNNITSALEERKSAIMRRVHETGTLTTADRQFFETLSSRLTPKDRIASYHLKLGRGILAAGGSRRRVWAHLARSIRANPIAVRPWLNLAASIGPASLVRAWQDWRATR